MDLNIIMTFLGFLAFLIIVTNSFVLYLMIRRRSLRSPTNVCLGSLAASDLLAGLIAIPTIIACNVTKDFKVTCHAMDMSSRFISISTVLHLLIVTIERYIMILHGMKYNLWVNKKRVTVTLYVTWIFAAFVTGIQLSWQLTRPQKLSAKIDIVYDIVCFFVFVVIALIVMALSYIRIFIALRYQLKEIQKYSNPVEKSNELRRRRVERKAAIIFGCMIITFIFCWFTYFFDGINEGFDLFSYPEAFYAVSLFLRYISPFINPLMYTFLKEDFKLAMKMVLCQQFRDQCSTSYLYQTQYGPSKSESSV